VPSFFSIEFSFAYGKGSGLVLDCGYVHTVATPVYEGFALQKGISFPLSFFFHFLCLVFLSNLFCSNGLIWIAFE
jgi:hypothetical protein